MDREYRFALVKQQLEGENNELQDYKARLAVAFADVAWLHASVACGALDEAAIGKLPRALHLFRSYARDLLRCYEVDIAPLIRIIGRPLNDSMSDKPGKQPLNERPGGL